MRPLTVGELIEKLQEQPDYLPVYLVSRPADDWELPVLAVTRGLMSVELS